MFDPYEVQKCSFFRMCADSNFFNNEELVIFSNYVMHKLLYSYHKKETDAVACTSEFMSYSLRVKSNAVNIASNILKDTWLNENRRETKLHVNNSEKFNFDDAHKWYIALKIKHIGSDE